MEKEDVNSYYVLRCEVDFGSEMKPIVQNLRQNVSNWLTNASDELHYIPSTSNNWRSLKFVLKELISNKGHRFFIAKLLKSFFAKNNLRSITSK